MKWATGKSPVRNPRDRRLDLTRPCAIRPRKRRTGWEPFIAMPEAHNAKCYIVKHGLDSFEALPNFIWNTDNPPKVAPHRYTEVRRGHRWIGFAYTTTDSRERPLSLVTGFYECTHEAKYRSIPSAGLPVVGGRKGLDDRRSAVGRSASGAGSVPPINDLLSPKRVWNDQAIVPISSDTFVRIRDYARSHEFDTSRIPLLKREPRCEQEVLAIVARGYDTLGIAEIVRVRKAFPDLLVKLKGRPEEVHLELEVYSDGFFSHGHHKQVENGRFQEDGKPVAVLCWIDNNKGVKDCVHKVYELQSLIREGKQIVW